MEGSNQTRWPPSSTYAIEKNMHAAVELNGAELFGCSELYTVLNKIKSYGQLSKRILLVTACILLVHYTSLDQLCF